MICSLIGVVRLTVNLFVSALFAFVCLQKAARLGELRDDHDPNMTHEGECYIMFMQTSNYLLKIFQEKRESGAEVRSPLGSVDFIDKYATILKNKMIRKDFDDINTVIDAYQYLVCYLLTQSDEKLSRELARLNGDSYAAKSQTQIYFLQPLAMAYFELEAIQRFEAYLGDNESAPDGILRVLRRLHMLYALWSLEKHIATLYEGDYFPPSYDLNPTRIIRAKILTLCSELKDDAVALVDTFAPTDFVLNSCLGYADGRVYEHLFDALSKSKNAFERPAWYEEFTKNKPRLGSAGAAKL